MTRDTDFTLTPARDATSRMVLRLAGRDTESAEFESDNVVIDKTSTQESLLFLKERNFWTVALILDNVVK